VVANKGSRHLNEKKSQGLQGRAALPLPLAIKKLPFIGLRFLTVIQRVHIRQRYKNEKFARRISQLVSARKLDSKRSG
jgi:hypothetical protein